MISPARRSVADDVREDGAKLDEVGRVLRHEALARLRIAEDAGERLVQLVREGTRERAQGGHAGKMRQFLTLPLRFRIGLFLPRDVHRDAEYSRRLRRRRRAVAATARGDPSHRAIGQDDAILDFVRTAGRQRVLDRGRARGAIVGMDASGQGGVINGFARLEAEELASFIRHPDPVVRHVPFPQRQLRALRRQAHALLADAQRFLRPSFVIDRDREQHQRSGRHQQEQLQGQRVFRGGLRQERPASVHRSPDRQNRDDQHGGAHAAKPKAEGRPDEQGNGRIEERGRSVRSRRQPIEGDVSDRENAHGQETCFQDAPGCGLDPFRGQLVDADQDDRHQHDRCHSIRDAEVAPFDPVVSSKVIGDGEGGPPEGCPKRNDDHRNQNKDDGFTKRDEMER